MGEVVAGTEGAGAALCFPLFVHTGPNPVKEGVGVGTAIAVGVVTKDLAQY